MLDVQLTQTGSIPVLILRGTMDAPDIPVLTTYLAPQRPILVIDVTEVKRLLPEGGEIMLRTVRKAKRQEANVILVSPGIDSAVDLLLAVTGASREFLRAKTRDEAIKSGESLLRQRLTKSVSTSRLSQKFQQAEEAAAPKEQKCSNCKAKNPLNADRCWSCGMLLSDRQTMLFHKPEFEPCPNCSANMLVGTDKCPLCSWTRPATNRMSEVSRAPGTAQERLEEPEEEKSAVQVAPSADLTAEIPAPKVVVSMPPPSDDAYKKAADDLSQVRKELAESAKELIAMQEKRTQIQHELSELELKKYEVDGRIGEQERRAGQKVAELEGKAGLIEATIIDLEKKREAIAGEIADQEVSLAEGASVVAAAGAAAAGAALGTAAVASSAVFGEADARRAEVESLREEIAGMVSRREELQAGIEQIRMLTDKTRAEAVAEIGRERALLAAQLEQEKSGIEIARQEQERVRAETSVAQEDVSRLAKEMESAIAEISASRSAAVVAAEEEHARIRAEHDREFAAARAEMETLRKDVEASRGEVALFADKRADMEIEIAAQSDQLAQIRSDVEIARAAAEEAMRAARAEADAQLARVIAERDEAAELRDQSRADLEASGRERDEALMELDGARAECEAARGDRDGVLSERDRLLTEKDRALVEKEESLGALQSRLDQSRAEHEAMAAERSATETELARLHELLDTERHNVEAHIETERRELLAQADADRAEASRLRVDLQNMNAERDSVDAALAVARAEIETAKVEAAAARAEIETAKVEASAARGEFEAAKVEAAAEAAAEVEASRRAFDASVDEATAKLAEVQGEIESARQELENIRAETQAAAAEKEILQSEALNDAALKVKALSAEADMLAETLDRERLEMIRIHEDRVAEEDGARSARDSVIVLEARCGELKMQLEELERKREESAALAASAEKSIEAAKPIEIAAEPTPGSGSLEDITPAMRAEIAALEEQMKAARSEAAESMARSERFRAESEHRRLELTSLHAEIDTLRVARNEVERDVQDTRHTVGREMLEERESLLAEFREEREKLEREFQDRREEFDRDTLQKREEVDRELHEIRSALTLEADQTREAVDRELKEIRSALESEIDQRREKNEKLFADQQSKAAAVEREAERWTAELQTRKAEVDALEERRQALSRIESDQAFLTAEYDRKRRELDDLESRIADAKREFADMPRASAPPPAPNEGIELLTKTLLAAMAENTSAIARMKTEGGASTLSSADQTAYEDRIKRMRAQWEAATAETDDLKRANRGLTIQIEEWEHRFEDSRRRLDETTRRTEEAERRVRDSDRRYSDSDQRIAEATTRAEDAERRAEEAEHRAEESDRRARQAMSGSMSRSAPPSAELDELRDRLSAERSLRESLEQKYGSAAAELDLMKMRVSQANDPYRDAMKEVELERRSVEEAIERLRKERDSIRREKEFELKSMEILKREIGRWMRERIKISSEQDAELIMAMRSEIDRLRAEKYEGAAQDAVIPPDLTAELQKARDESKRAKDELARVRQEISAAGNQKEAVAAAIAKEQAARAAAEQRVHELESREEASKMKIAAIDDQRAQSDARLAEATEKLAQAEKNLLQARQSTDAHADEALASALESSRLLKRRIEILESEAIAAEVLRVELMKLKDAAKTTEDLRPQVESARSLVDELKSELAAAEEAESRASLAVKELEAERAELTRRLEERDAAGKELLGDQTQALENALDSARREVEAARTETRDAAAEIKALAKRLESEMRDRDEISTALAGLRRESDGRADAARVMLEKLRVETKAAEELRLQVESVRRRADELQSELAAAREAEIRAVGAVKALEGEREALNRGYQERDAAGAELLGDQTRALENALDSARREVEAARTETRDAAAEIMALSERLESEMRSRDEAASALAGLRRESEALERRREELTAEQARIMAELAREREARLSAESLLSQRVDPAPGEFIQKVAVTAAASTIAAIASMDDAGSTDETSSTAEITSTDQRVATDDAEITEPKHEESVPAEGGTEATIGAGEIELEAAVPELDIKEVLASKSADVSDLSDTRLLEEKPEDQLPAISISTAAPTRVDIEIADSSSADAQPQEILQQFVSRPDEEALSIETLRQRAFDEEDAGRSTDAFRTYNLILIRDPGNISALHNLALIRYRSGDIDGAMQLCLRLEGLKKELPKECRKMIAEVRRHRSAPAPVWGRLFGR